MIVTLSSPGFNSIAVDLVPVGSDAPPAPAYPPTPAPPPAPGPTPPAPTGPFDSGTCRTFPVTWRNSSAANEYDQAATNEFTDASPQVRFAAIPFKVLAGATSLGATQLPYIGEVEGNGGGGIRTRTSVSRNRCDFTPQEGITFALGDHATHSNSFSANDATLSGGGEFNLTSGDWFYNIELVGNLPAKYNYNRIVDFQWIS